MVGYRGKFYFDGQDVKKNTTKRTSYRYERCSVGVHGDDSAGSA